METPAGALLSSRRRSEESELRAAVQYAVIQLCAQEEQRAASSSSSMSSSAISALAELTFQYATTLLAPDLELFANHAGRKTITEADVKLVARKNPNGLLEQLDEFCRVHTATDVGMEDKRKRPKKKSAIQLSTKETDFNDAGMNDSSAGGDDSSSLSSDADILARHSLEAARKKTAAKIQSTLPPKSNKTWNHNDTDTSDEDDENNNNQSLSKKRPNAAATARKMSQKPSHAMDLDDSSDSDTETNKAFSRKSTPLPKEPSRRFRLQSASQAAADNSSEDDDHLLTGPSLFGKQKPSKVQQILANLSQESLLSHDDDDAMGVGKGKTVLD